MKIGITGTKSGLTIYQHSKILDILTALFEEGAEFHHGGAIGVDIECAKIAKQIGYRIMCHPPIEKEHECNIPNDFMYEPCTHFKRNRHIVNTVDHLIVIPYHDSWQPNGGTWYTHDYAKKHNKQITIIYPTSK